MPLSNGGFEVPFGTSSDIPIPDSYGHWLGFKNVDNPWYPERSSARSHSGSYSLRIRQTGGGENKAVMAVQDIEESPEDLRNGFSLQGWVSPVLNDTTIYLYGDWDRESGEAAFRNYAVLSASSIRFRVWGVETEVPFSLPYDGGWHSASLTAKSDGTGLFKFDGVTVGSISGGITVPFGTATVLVGSGNGDPLLDNEAYWDDIYVSLESISVGGSTPPLRQRQRLVNVPRMRQAVH